MKAVPIIAASSLLTFASAQGQPVLKLHYPLDNTSGREAVKRQDGVVTGATYPITDRFGNPNGAMAFEENAYMGVPALTAGIDYEANGMTVSFWTYIDEMEEKQYGRYPWKDSDPAKRAFYARLGTETLWGFYQRADRAVIDRYLTDIHGQKRNWNVWLWDPVNFTRQTGWCHIILSHRPTKTYVYMFKPDGSFASCVYYFGIQTIPPASSDWGLGNDSGSALVLDDFKVYEGYASEADARMMHEREALPDGMYRITTAADDSKYVHTYRSGSADSVPLEILSKDPDNDFHTHKWVFEPVDGQQGVCLIRMAYEDQYVHLWGNSGANGTQVELLGYDPAFASSYQWYVEPCGDGSFYLKSNLDRTKYLHTARHSSSESAELEILNYEEQYASVYKWNLHLLKTRGELQEDLSAGDKASDFVLSDNTAMGLIPVLPAGNGAMSVELGRGVYPSLLTLWRLHKSKDDSYRLYNASHSDYNLCPKGRSLAAGTPIEAAQYDDEYSSYYDFVVEKTNPYGRRARLKVARNQALTASSSSTSLGSSVTLSKENGSGHSLWALYQSETANSPRQIYDIKPGTYKIIPLSNPNMTLAVQGTELVSTADLVITSTNLSSSVYWALEFETDASGNPVKDGTYIIRHNESSNLVMHPKAHRAASSVNIELYEKDVSNIFSEKWFIEPTRDGTKSYYIRSAANPEMMLHLKGHSAAEGTKAELLGYESTYGDMYKWLLVPM